MAATKRQIIASLMLQAQGYTPAGAAALVGNFSQESGPNLPSAFRTRDLDHGSNGLPQWRLERLKAYEEYVQSLHPGASSADLWLFYGRMAYQLQYVAIELKRDYATLDAKLRETPEPSVSDLAAAVCWNYERPNKAESGITNRIKWAEGTYNSAPHCLTRSQALAELTTLGDNHMDAAVGAGTGAVGIGAGSITAAAHLAGTGAHWWQWGLVAAGGVVAGIMASAAGMAAKTSGSTKLPATATKTGPATAG